MRPSRELDTHSSMWGCAPIGVLGLLLLLIAVAILLRDLFEGGG